MIRYLGVLVSGFALAGVLLLGCASRGSARGSSSAATGCENCARMIGHGSGWCDLCSKGVVKGKPVDCWECYVAKTGGNACTKHGGSN